MTPKTLLARDPALLTESQWASIVNETAAIGGWRRYHTYLSKRSPAGFPDLVLVKPPRLIFAELKTDAKTSKPTEQQEEWLEDLRGVAEGVELLRGLALDVAEKVQVAANGIAESPLIEVHVWRPSDWPTVVETLTGRKPREEAA
jgi:hypothetical protein